MTWLQMVVGLVFAIGFAFVWVDLRGEKVERRTAIPLGPFWGAGGIVSYLITFFGG